MRVFKLYHPYFSDTAYYTREGLEDQIKYDPEKRGNKLTVQIIDDMVYFSFSTFRGLDIKEVLDKTVFTKAVLQIINSEIDISHTIHSSGAGLCAIHKLEFHKHLTSVSMCFYASEHHDLFDSDSVCMTHFEFLKLSYFLQDRSGDTQTDKIHITPELKEAVVKYIDALEASKELRIKQAEEKILSVFKGEIVK